MVEWCYMCKKVKEKVDHLLLDCEYASELWSLVFCLFGEQWVMPHRVPDVVACWKGCLVRWANDVV